MTALPSALEAGDTSPRRIVVVNAGIGTSSSSRRLADRIAQKALDQLTVQRVPATVSVIDLGPLAGEISHAIVSGHPQGELLAAIQTLAAADGAVVATPVYKAGISGLLKSFVDILDNDLLIATPIALAATAGTARHALVIDDQLRPLFAFMRAMPVPTSVFAAPEDWADPTLGRRIDRTAIELATLVASSIRSAITGQGWDRYQHTWGGNARPDRPQEVDFDTDLMRLATGGAAMPGTSTVTGSSAMTDRGAGAA
ncbi:CE1759 family FMN reductase [Micromonospora profundi]|uniref:NAD(P)H-dependent oxidoreductase n=1 Tax=Micromonospora profundi TaxID=1420889 RepID=A0AAJ6L564_9ACTN|nr:CE1759 family FMN reductase [Micromonospora profundi]WLS45388.1 NAD(P)H-dependent oxidoreductase [Micromonospora profundi]